MSSITSVEAPLPTGRLVQWLLIRSIRWGIHVAALIGVFLVGISAPALIALAVSTLLGLLGVTLCYHRYFAHGAFKTSRWFQFILALWGATSLQRGPIWWAAVHRHHHRYSDMDQDWHSPRHGFWHAHNGWLESPRILDVSYANVTELNRYPELRFLDTFYHLPSLLLVAILALVGAYLDRWHPQLGATAWQMVVWGFFVRTVIVWQLTFATNSVLHCWGRRRFDTRDDSRNSYLLGLINLGDGFHNNHHRYPRSAQHGFYLWEIDITYYVIKLMQSVGLVWNVRTPPLSILKEGLDPKAKKALSGSSRRHLRA